MRQQVKWHRSFRFAYEGVKYALSTQRNMKFHFFAAFVVLLLALYLGLPKLEILFILLAVTLMIVTELINTAVEKAVDLAMPDLHPLAKIAKDVAAASVLVSAAFAAIVGMIVFYDPIDRLFINVRSAEGHSFSAGMVWVLLSLVMLTVIVVETRFSSKGNHVRPSLLAAVAFAISTFIASYVTITLIALLAYLLAFMVMLVLYDKRSRSMPALVLGALIGCFITVLAYYLMNV
ncbi:MULTISPECIES: diacylglycerol kinase family protein [Paenibacillus]|uniref:Diacylglycerol kinase family protein n=1 Tax=Paenibacillus radicis (ex Xue et al. 2023) TaxID=2972489 RepID=A0ABT1YE00_9BACL|nr:diacylglycerol kinase family protein [Paenibacillus radicis (ex Xue et al. 2023)]MCR8631420.1 diacylglycerol kinase family protein [Paenibacillus radicis (ex Xue et al. 2023)]